MADFPCGAPNRNSRAKDSPSTVDWSPLPAPEMSGGRWKTAQQPKVRRYQLGFAKGPYAAPRCATDGFAVCSWKAPKVGPSWCCQAPLGPSRSRQDRVGVRSSGWPGRNPLVFRVVVSSGSPRATFSSNRESRLGPSGPRLAQCSLSAELHVA